MALAPAGFSSLPLCKDYAQFRKTVSSVALRLITNAKVPFFRETALHKKQGGVCMQSALSKALAKITYIYVLGSDGKPQMPTKRKRHVEKLLNAGKARIVEKVPFTIQ